MPRGPSPDTWLDEELGPQPVHFGLVEFQTRGRLQIPKPVRLCAAWLGESAVPKAVFELADPGQVIIWAWSPMGETLTDRRRQLVAKIAADPDAETELVAIEERYLRVTIEARARFHRNDRIMAHLGIAPGATNALYTVGFANRVEIWSDIFRLRRRQELSEHLHWVPET